MGDIVVRIREQGARGDIKAAEQASGISRATLWRRAKLADHRDLIEHERPANVTEALRLVERAKPDEPGPEEAADEPAAKRKGGRPKRDLAEVLAERLRSTAASLASLGAM